MCKLIIISVSLNMYVNPFKESICKSYEPSKQSFPPTIRISRVLLANLPHDETIFMYALCMHTSEENTQ